MVKQLLLITGMTGSGMTTLVAHFKNMGIASVTMGDVIRALARKKGLPPTPENFGRLFTEIRKEGGDDAVAKLCIDEIDNIPDGLILIDGIKNMEEVEVFSRKFKVTLVAVFADQKTRYARLLARGRSDDPPDIATFKARDARELGFNLGHAIALADYTILNEGNLEDLKAEFDILREHLRGI